MNAGSFASLIEAFAQNWISHRPDLSVILTGAAFDIDLDHPLHDELEELCKGRAASLPFFTESTDVIWCSLAPDAASLRQTVAALDAWVLPSFGGTIAGDGIIQPAASKGNFAANIIAASPDGYYRWHCPKQEFDRIMQKLQSLRSLERLRPPRRRPPRPSLYELRARFASALLVGNRDGAESIIGQMDLFQLETAVNTQFMRIRLWHHFGELDRILNHPDLPHLLAQPLPPRVREWINDAVGATVPPASDDPAQLPTAEAVAEVPTVAADIHTGIEAPSVTPIPNWCNWFLSLKLGDRAAAESFLQERPDKIPLDLSPSTIASLSANLDELVIDDTLRIRERNLIVQGLSDLLEVYVRESEFPRAALGGFYLSIVRLWCALHAGNTTGQEHGHVLLELSSALLQLNQSPEEVCQTLEDWWKAKPAPSQLYFALDAIELLERELPGTEAPMSIWIEAANLIKRASEALPVSDRALWRRIGTRLNFDDATISEYLPPEPTQELDQDPLAAAALQHVAIVCLREEQAKQAASEIQKRTGAKVTVVTSTAAGAETQLACTAEVVLFVWLASTHAVFRAFDGFDRRKLSYVQGTGSTSIVKSLERWVVAHGFS